MHNVVSRTIELFEYQEQPPFGPSECGGWREYFQLLYRLRAAWKPLVLDDGAAFWIQLEQKEVQERLGRVVHAQQRPLSIMVWLTVRR